MLYIQFLVPYENGMRFLPFSSLVPRRSYNTKIVERYENPRNVGSLDRNSREVGTGIVGAPSCGDVMKLQLRVKGDVIEDAKFKTFGCGSAIASSSFVTDDLKHKTLQQANQVRNRHIAEALGLPPIKLHCSMLAEDAVRSAVNDYRSKNTSR